MPSPPTRGLQRKMNPREEGKNLVEEKVVKNLVEEKIEDPTNRFAFFYPSLFPIDNTIEDNFSSNFSATRDSTDIGRFHLIH